MTRKLLPFSASNILGISGLRTFPFSKGLKPSGFKVNSALLHMGKKTFLIYEDLFQNTQPAA